MTRKWLFDAVFAVSIVFLLGCNLWLVGNISTRYEILVATDVELSDDELILTLDSIDSASLFRGYSYDIINHTLYLTVRHGPSLFRSGLWPVKVHIRDEALGDVHSVYLRDGKLARLLDIVLPFQKESGVSLLPAREGGDTEWLPVGKGGDFSWL